ncbi:MAG: TspO/MBR family protein [Coxiellaceae bacterium]|nr:TspO/MBR family protein [Coxiellaceae bacterium]
MIKKTVWLTAWIFGFQFVAYVIHQFFHLHLSPWYQNIAKSPLHPPEIIFPIVWSTLYVMITIAGWLLWQERRKNTAKTALKYYAIQIAMTWAWAPIIFAFHWTGVGFFWTLGIFVATFMTIITAAEQFEFATALLGPSLLWLLYVAYLCGYLWLQN